MLELTTAETFFYTFFISMATSNLWQYLKGLTARNNSSDNNANQFFCSMHTEGKLSTACTSTSEMLQIKFPMYGCNVYLLEAPAKKKMQLIVLA